MRFFSRRWWWTTLLVIAAIAVMIRLGIWQLDRLEQRRQFNLQVSTQRERSALVLGAEAQAADLKAMAYRRAVVRGEYDFGHEIVLRNQVWNGLPGANLITPLRIAQSDRAILVNRGWIPLDALADGSWQSFPRSGQVTVQGILRLSETASRFSLLRDPTPAPGQQKTAWSFLDLEAIDRQIPYELLPVYLQADPDPALPANLDDWPRAALPFPNGEPVELTEGPHLGYAVQWFLFAGILAIGYPIFLRRESGGQKHETQNYPN